MPSYERCNETTGKNARGFAYRCNKKAGHTGEHSDTKNAPVYRWANATEESE